MWARPDLPELSASKDKLVFQQLELDHYIGKARKDMPGASSGPVPIMRVFGVTKDGNSICCHIHGFHPYFFIPAPTSFTQDHLPAFRKETVLITLSFLSFNAAVKTLGDNKG